MVNIKWFQNRLTQGAMLTKLVKDQTMCIAITTFATVQTGLTFLGINGWICPFRHYLACPCPGCGLTRATVALVKRDFKQMLAYHALAPLFLIGFIVIVLGAVLPSKQRKRLISLIEFVEIKTRVGFAFCAVLLTYWLIRLLFFTDSYMNLVMG